MPAMVLRFAVVGFCSSIASVRAEVEASHSVSVESAAHLSTVSQHSTIEKPHRAMDRINIDAAGATLMEGASVGQASSRPPAGMVRREHKPISHRVETAAASELEEDEEFETHHEAASTAVSWTACENGSCKCQSRRRMVVRYQRERAAGSFASQANTFTNWHYRAGQRPYNSTPIAEFNKGFTDFAHKLQMCGGDKAWAKDCLTEPKTCTFDTENTNPYDAKAGEYCCSGERQYCSYKCQGTESFSCPALSTDINFPGGMDPAGPDVYKKCYTAQYPHGMNPESATDADKDVDGKADD